MCDARALEKEKRLMALWRKSKRQRCRCGLPIHAEKCFLHWSGIGDRPHLGSDTLTPREYKWLQRRGKL